MSLDVNRIVAVNISVSPLALQRAGFGIMNIIGISDAIPLSERVRAYNSITEVAVDFETTDEEYIAATIFFSQVPRPTTLYISRRLAEDSNATLFGSTSDVESDYTVWAAISDGSMEINIDGGSGGTVDGLDFSTASSMNDVATVVDTATGGVGIGAMWDGLKFIFTNTDTSGVGTSISHVLPNVTGTDISAMTGGTAASTGAYIDAGLDAETIPESLDVIEAINSKWYGFAFTEEVRDASVTTAGTAADALAAAAWAEARTKTFWNNSSDANTLLSANTTNISYLLEQLGYSRTATVYNAGDYPAISLFARGATVDFNATDSTITYKFKQLPGLAPTDLSASQANALTDFNCNYYAEFGTQLSGDSVAMLAEGVMANGRFIDEVVGIDWLQNAAQTDVFNYLFQSPTKIPQTDEGMAGVAQVLENSLAQAVNNGLAAPGTVTIDDVDTFLPKGYEVFVGLVEDQNQADREARKAPPISFILKGAGAIHEVTITGTFVR